MLRKQKILVVDDDRDFRRAVCGVLRINGFETVEESNPLAVLKTVADTAPNLALLDLYMPGGDGIELVRTVREREPELPLVVVSGRISVEDLQFLRQLDVEDILAKPVNKSILVEKVKQILPTPPKRLKPSPSYEI